SRVPVQGCMCLLQDREDRFTHLPAETISTLTATRTTTLSHVHRGGPDNRRPVGWVLRVSVHNCLDWKVRAAAEAGSSQAGNGRRDKVDNLSGRRSPDDLAGYVFGLGWMVVMPNRGELQIKSSPSNGRAGGLHLYKR